MLLVYSWGPGSAAALALARASAGRSASRATARRWRTAISTPASGWLGAGPELDALAATLDETAARLSAALELSGRARRAQDLITAVSHDLRTPLASLRAMVEAIDDGVVDDPRTLAATRARCGGQSNRSHLVDDLFELVQLDAGAIEAESERARLEDVVGSAVAACDASGAREGPGSGDRDRRRRRGALLARLVRVLQNLLQNAIRHTPADGTVRIEAPRPRAVELVVEDTGRGDRPGGARRVFEPFWRGDAARAGQGSGLGLALAKRIVESLGGQIRGRERARSGIALRDPPPALELRSPKPRNRGGCA